MRSVLSFLVAWAGVAPAQSAELDRPIINTICLLFAASLLSAQTYTIVTLAGGAPPATPIQATTLPLAPSGVTTANGYNGV